MSREIKFRGKKIDIGEYVYGYYFTNGLENHIHLAKHYIISKISGHIGAKDITIVYHEVIPETVGQFTGLYDKNGVEIYEGDILCLAHKDTHPKMRRKPLVVKYVEDGFVLDENISLRNMLEVIGNIHDNKELVE